MNKGNPDVTGARGAAVSAHHRHSSPLLLRPRLRQGQEISDIKAPAMSPQRPAPPAAEGRAHAVRRHVRNSWSSQGGPQEAAREPGSERWRRSVLSTRRARSSWRHLARSALPSCNQLSRVRREHGSVLLPVSVLAACGQRVSASRWWSGPSR